MSRIIPEAWLPECAMKRIITHWTAGSYHASGVDREHYHIIIEGDGKLVRGDYSIRDNLSTGDGAYAAHTRGCNTGSIGVSCAAMQGAIQSPFYAGTCPLTREQYDSLTLVCADLCEFYNIPVAPSTVLNHGEVEGTLGLPQRQKWDIDILPWDVAAVVGPWMRSQILAALHGHSAGGEGAPITVEIEGKTITDEAFIKNGVCFAPLRPIAQAREWVIASFGAMAAEIMLTHDHSEYLPCTLRGDRAYAHARDIAWMAGWPPPTYMARQRLLCFSTDPVEVK